MMNSARPAGNKPLRSLLLLFLFVLFGATVIFHDFFCQEHLHELGCPLHCVYENAESFEAETFFGGLPPWVFLSFSSQTYHPDEFIKNIFHPPDRLF